MARSLPTNHDTAAAVLVAMRDELDRLNRLNAAHARAGNLTSRHVDVAIALGQDLTDAAERFRRKYHPRVRSIAVAAGVVYAVSHTGRAHAVYVSSVPADVREQSADLGREMARLHAVPNSHGEQS